MNRWQAPSGHALLDPSAMGCPSVGIGAGQDRIQHGVFGLIDGGQGAPPDNDFRHLDEAVNLVEKTGRRIVAEQADVRDFQRWLPGMRFGQGN